MKSLFTLSLAAAIPALVAVALPRTADAHISLKYPPSRIVENAQGDPQKMGPCTPGTPTNKRTKFKPGDKVMVQWTETVHHPGHFRISFTENDTSVFKDPKSPTDIVEPPTGAILKDGLFPDHKAKTPLQYEVTLPNVTCKTCTMQVVQVMLEGSDVSMYYHCADLELADDAAGGTPDAGTPTADAGAGGASGTGGVTGGGGSAAGGSSGGSTGTGGGSPAASGGSTGGSPAATGGSTGTGGSTPSGSAGSSGTGGSGSKGTGGAAPSTPPDSPPSSCTIGSDRQPVTVLGLLAVVGLALGLRRRRG